MANCVKCRFSLNLQLFSVVLKSAPVKYIATYCPWDSHQIRSSCTAMSVWWQNNPSLWLSWTVSIPKWVSILQHVICAPSDAKLLEGGVNPFFFTFCRWGFRVGEVITGQSICVALHSKWRVIVMPTFSSCWRNLLPGVGRTEAHGFSLDEFWYRAC